MCSLLTQVEESGPCRNRQGQLPYGIRKNQLDSQPTMHCQQNLTASLLSLLVGVCALSAMRDARAWGDEGHKIIALIAYGRLSEPARHKVDALLADDEDTLTPADFASRATWADRYRDSDRNGSKTRYLSTRQWHFVDINLDDLIAKPDLDTPCHGFPKLPQNVLASNGPAGDCVVTKIEQFQQELQRSASPAERLLALKFLMHFVGDLHQPLHAAEHNHDKGGNEVLVLFGRHHVAQDKLNLHAYWDTQLVSMLGKDPNAVAQSLILDMKSSDAQRWEQGTPQDWAKDTFAVAKAKAYDLARMEHRSATVKRKREDGSPMLMPVDVTVLDGQYANDMLLVAREQLQKAGVRLATVLEGAL